MARRTTPIPQVLAVRVLHILRAPGSFSNRVLADHLERHHELTAGARGLVTSLVYGVLRQRNRLDAHIDACLPRADKLTGLPREILRVGAYEILELGRPATNAIDHTIATARTFDDSGRLGKLAHRVLAQVEAEAAAQDQRLASGAPLGVLERRWSIPRWLGGRWLRHLGPEVALRRGEALAAALPVDLRVDLSRISAQEARERLLAERSEAEVMLVAGQPQALRVRGGGDLFFGPLYGDGLISVQGLAAQQPAIALAPEPGTAVLDGCAGLGTKTLQLAELMGRRGRLVAVDRDSRKLHEHGAALSRGPGLGKALDYHSLAADLSTPSSELDALGPFDGLLLDVPCTGLGNLSRHPEIRWQRVFADIAAATPLQHALLQACLRRVRPGGRLVYAVCSLEPEEGPQQVAATLDAGGLTLEDEQHWTPEDQGTEGFYFARLRVDSFTC